MTRLKQNRLNLKWSVIYAPKKLLQELVPYLTNVSRLKLYQLQPNPNVLKPTHFLFNYQPITRSNLFIFLWYIVPILIQISTISKIFFNIFIFGIVV